MKLAKNLYGWDELGLCLSWGFFRAAVICKKFPDRKINFVINDCDNISSTEEKKQILEIIEEKGYLNNIWSEIAWFYPLKPIIHKLNSLELVKNLELKREIADKALAWLRKNCPSSKKRLIANSKLPLIGKDLEFKKWNNLKKTLLSEYEKEINWALEFDSSKESEKRANQLLEFIKKDKSKDFLSLQINIAKKLLNKRIKNLNVNTFSNFFSIKNINSEQHKLLRLFMKKPKETLRIYNRLFLKSGVKQYQDRIPFFGIFKQNRHYIRETIALEYVKDLKKYEAISPKAMVLYIQSKLIGSTYCSTAPNIELADKFCSILNLNSYPLAFVKFNPIKIFGKKWKTEIDVYPKSDYQRKALEYLRKKSDNFWEHRLPLIFIYIVGGQKLIDKAISTAEIDIASSPPK